jgi:GT2 family glycosyltransferase
MAQDLDAFARWLKARQPRLEVRDEDLVERFWRVHPRFQFLKSLPWGWNVLDIGAGNGGLTHWRGWLKPDRTDLNLYGVDRNEGEFRELYAGWETINLDREMPSFAGVDFNAIIASHLIEYLGAPERLIAWLGTRMGDGARLYFEWIGPSTLDLPTREQLTKHGIEVLTSNFIDDWEHKQAPDLARVEKWLGDAGFEVMVSGGVDLGILGEEMFARAADRDTRSMGYWSLTRSSLYTVAIKSDDAAASLRSAEIDNSKLPIVQSRKRPLPEAASSAPLRSLPTKVRFDPSAATVSDCDLRRFAFGANRILAPLSREYDPGSLEIHWVIPDFCAGAGGHMNIFRICNRLEASGHRLSLWIRDPQFHHDPAAAKETLNRHFQPICGPVHFADNGLSEAAGDIIVATDAWTVPLVFSASQFKRRFYFVQDFEPAFVPVGTLYLAAEATYRRDLDCICGGPWLEQLMRDRYGRWARKFWQAADPTVYYPSERSDEIGRLPHIAFYFRAFTDRRAVELGLLALELLARRGIQFHVDFFGQHELPFAAAPYAATNHGVCDAIALAQLYQAATIGLVFSATNYSIVPQEMMACGLPVLDLDVESTRAVYDPAAVRLALPEPQAVADAIETMLANPIARQTQAKRALSWVSQFSWSQSATLVETAFRDRLVELGFVPATPAVSQRNEAFATVVIPTLDGGDLLRNVVDCVLAQRLPGSLQLICIDSASTDGTAEYLAAHPGVELISIDRADFQHGRTRNLGVDAAAGEFVAFLTQDALPADDCWLYNLVCGLINHPNAGGVFGRHIAYPEHSEFIKRDLIRHFAGFDALPVCVSLEDPKIREMFAEPSGRQRLHFYSDNNSCLRRSVGQKIPFPEVDFGEDQLFALELLKQGYGKAYSRYGVVYHSHDDAPELVEQRAYTEAKFYHERFGYRLVRSAAHAEQALAELNAADQSLARESSLPAPRLARRLAQNAARIDGYRRAMREYRPSE